jgi:aspartyl protease family protein
MWKPAVIIGAAVISALAAVQGVSMLDSRPAPVAADVSASAPSQADYVARHASAAEVSKDADGHFWAEASVNGRQVRFLVDTGATVVALTADDARRLGIDLHTLKFERSVATAAGASRAADVELDYVSVAGARVEHVPALVFEKGLGASLLGMSYLGRLSRFEATQTALILRP